MSIEEKPPMSKKVRDLRDALEQAVGRNDWRAVDAAVRHLDRLGSVLAGREAKAAKATASKSAGDEAGPIGLRAHLDAAFSLASIASEADIMDCIGNAIAIMDGDPEPISDPAVADELDTVISELKPFRVDGSMISRALAAARRARSLVQAAEYDARILRQIEDMFEAVGPDLLEAIERLRGRDSRSVFPAKIGSLGRELRGVIEEFPDDIRGARQHARAIATELCIIGQMKEQTTVDPPTTVQQVEAVHRALVTTRDMARSLPADAGSMRLRDKLSALLCEADIVLERVRMMEENASAQGD